MSYGLGGSNVDLSGLNRLRARVSKIADLADETNMRPLLDALGRIIIEDNRKGVLAGTDRYGQPMTPVKYRGYTPSRKAEARPRKTFGTSPAALRLDNLTTAQYRKLTGPPLAPRRTESRVIRNLAIQEPAFDGQTWTVWAAWLKVLNAKGRPFLQAHFDGKGRLPQRDLRGVRPDSMRLARATVIRFFRAILQQARV